jgi:hypothetical protein
MSTAYKYVEREVEDQINWAEVGSNLTGILKEENRVREEKKGAIDAATRQYSEVLNSTPTGQNTKLNKFALNASADLQEQMLMQERLLKSGQLSPREYTIMRQNLTDGTDQAFSLFENYNAEYDIRMARMKTNQPYGDQASIIESWEMELMEGFGNFNESKLVINSRDGIMSMAKMIPDPNYKGTGTAPLIPDMDNLATVQNLENRLKTQYNKYDVLGHAQEYLDSLGAEERSEIERQGSTYKASIFKKINDTTAKVKGGYKSMSDDEKAELSRVTGVPIKELDSITLFQESQDNWVKGQLATGGIAGASVILDFRNNNPKTNEPFKPMMDSPEARKLAKTDSNIVIMKNVNGRSVPELSEDQQIYAERILKSAINSGVDYKEEHSVSKTESESRAKTSNEIKIKGDAEDNKAVIGNVAKLWYGTDAEVKTAEDYLKGVNSNIRAITRTPDGVVIEFKNGDPAQEIPFKANGVTLTQEEFVEGNANYFFDAQSKVKDIKTLLKTSSIDKSKEFNKESKGFSFNKTNTKEPEEDAYDRITLKEVTDSGFTPDLFVKDNEDKTLTNIQGYITSLPGMGGYKVETSNANDDEISIFDEDGKVVEIFELDDSDGFDSSSAPEYIKRLLLRSKNLAKKEDPDAIYNKTKGKRNSTPNKNNPATIEGGRAYQFNF